MPYHILNIPFHAIVNCFFLFLIYLQNHISLSSQPCLEIIFQWFYSLVLQIYCRFVFVLWRLRIILENVIAPVWKVLLNVISEKSITSNVSNIYRSFELTFFIKSFIIEFPHPLSFPCWFKVSNNPTYLLHTPSTDVCELTHDLPISFFTFLTTFYACSLVIVHFKTSFSIDIKLLRRVLEKRWINVSSKFF